MFNPIGLNQFLLKLKNVNLKVLTVAFFLFSNDVMERWCSPIQNISTCLLLFSTVRWNLFIFIFHLFLKCTLELISFS